MFWDGVSSIQPFVVFPCLQRRACMTLQVVSNTIHHAIEATKSIVRLMMARRERALGKSNGKVV